ncbi:MAG: xanthine dehydrogenase family protein molybdopterin-binding subunit [Acidimicrobiia bacterium]
MWVGRRLRRFEDPALLRGEGRFVADFMTGESKVVRFVRSPVARGRILGIEVPDGAVVVTGEDLADLPPIRPLLHRDDYVPISQRLLAREEVRYAGEPVAVVVGDNASEAEDLAEKVFVDIEPVAPVIGLEAGLSPNALPVHPDLVENTVVDAHFSTPDFESGWDAASRFVTIRVRTHRQSAMPLEARGCVAQFDRRTGQVTLISSTQGPHIDRAAIIELLGLSESQLQVIAPDVGGAFGQKHSLAAEDVIAVWLARRFRTSMTWIEDRRENFGSSFHSRDHIYDLTGGFSDEGRLLALKADILCDVGAYSCYPVTCGVEPLMAMAEMPGPYDVTHYSARARAVMTNTCPIAPYRGVSRPSITLAMERLMDEAASELGLDRLDMRRINLVTTFPYTSATGLVFDEGSYLETLEQAVRTVDLPGFLRRQAAERQRGVSLGIGFASFSERTGYGTPAFAARKMDVVPGFETVEMAMGPSGQVEARIGASPHGQGLETSLAQLIADELGIDPQEITVIHGDTSRTPFGWGSFASRSMVLSGGACKMAATTLRAKLATIASGILEAATEDLIFADGQIKVAGSDVGIPIRDAARIAYFQAHRLEAGSEPGLRTTATYDPAGTFSNACHVAVVRVDLDTGQVEVERYIVIEDAGLLINPMIADGQVHGGVAQGIGTSLYEELKYDADGNLMTSSLVDYLPPTAYEVPAIEIEHLETLSDSTITGAKGLGEGGAIGVPAAIINAINDALRPLGVGVDSIPATPERIRRLVGAVR